MDTDAAAAASADGLDALLSMEAVVVAFGGLRALGGVDLRVERGERLALLGPNGAGKTTLFNVIAGDIVHPGVAEAAGRTCAPLGRHIKP